MASGYIKEDAAVTAPPLPQGWMVMPDPSGSGRPLYYNAATGRTSFARPVVRVLPAGWVKSQMPDGKTIFIHLETQRCSLEWPDEAPKPQSPPVQMPQLSRYTTEPGKIPAESKPQLLRSQTVPIQTQQSPAMVTMSINAQAARKAVPGLEEAYAIHQLSERNNTRTLSNKFTSDLAHTTSAMKDATISGASLATRTGKVVGQTLVSRKKMAKASMKMVVHTGALGVKTGRAVKGLMGEMVDAADKKGRYQPKVRPLVPYDGQVQPQVVGQVQCQGIGQVHAYEYQQQQQMAMTNVQMTPYLPSVAPAPAFVPTRIPARKPVQPQPQPLPLQQAVSNQATINIQPTLNTNLSVQSSASTGPELAIHSVGLPSQLASNPVDHETAITPADLVPSPDANVISQSTNPQQIGQSVLVQSHPPVTTQDLHSPLQPAPSQPIANTAATGPPVVLDSHPPKPVVNTPLLQSSISASVQAQGTLNYQAAASPPSYSQATMQPVATTGATRPPGRPLTYSGPAPQHHALVAQRPQVIPAPLQAQPSLQLQPTSIYEPVVQYVNYPQQQLLPSQQIAYTAPNSSAASQAVASNPQPVVVEHNQTIFPQSSDGQDLMMAQMQMQMQMAMAQQQQSATSQLILQQQAESQSMMLAQTQATSTQQPVYVDQNVYIDQSQSVDITNVTNDQNDQNVYVDQSQTLDITNETNVQNDQDLYVDQRQTLDVTDEQITTVDYQDTTEIAYEDNTEVVFAETGYSKSYVVDETAGGEEVYIEEDAITEDYYENDYEADGADDSYDVDIGV